VPLPFELHPVCGAAEWLRGDDTLRVKAGPRSDWFVDPGGREPTMNAPGLVGAVPDGDFLFGARVAVEFGASFDAGVLVLWRDERTWAKLCFEFSPDGRPMVVSVVTRGVSDDANSFTIDSREVWLRIARLGAEFAFHASTDGHRWELIRHFALEGPGELQVGFEAQSPTGDGCDVTFADMRFEERRLEDIRSGD
jgi:regulation of enolase protein 1 (concanavalin A-like superfamily)